MLGPKFSPSACRDRGPRKGPEDPLPHGIVTGQVLGATRTPPSQTAHSTPFPLWAPTLQPPHQTQSVQGTAVAKLCPLPGVLFILPRVRMKHTPTSCKGPVQIHLPESAHPPSLKHPVLAYICCCPLLSSSLPGPLWPCQGAPSQQQRV